MTVKKRESKKQRSPNHLRARRDPSLSGLAAVALAIITGASEGLAPKMLTTEEPKATTQIIVIRREEQGRQVEVEVQWGREGKNSVKRGVPPIEEWELRYLTADGQQGLIIMRMPVGSFEERINRWILNPARLSESGLIVPGLNAVELAPSLEGSRPDIIINFGALSNFARNNVFDLSPSELDILMKAGKVRASYLGTLQT